MQNVRLLGCVCKACKKCDSALFCSTCLCFTVITGLQLNFDERNNFWGSSLNLQQEVFLICNKLEEEVPDKLALICSTQPIIQSYSKIEVPGYVTRSFLTWWLGLTRTVLISKLPRIWQFPSQNRLYTVCIYGSGQPYWCYNERCYNERQAWWSEKHRKEV